MKSTIYLCGGAAVFANYAAALQLAGATLANDWAVCDGLVLPGGGDVDPVHYGQVQTDCRGLDVARDEQELWLCQRFLSQKKPILGICRGAQVLTVVLGGSLHQHVPGHAGLPDGSDRVHATNATNTLAQLYGPRFFVNSWHHQAVAQLGAQCRVTQTADDGVIEAFEHETLPVLAVQWHPERLCGALARTDAVSGLPLLRHFVSLCGRNFK